MPNNSQNDIDQNGGYKILNIPQPQPEQLAQPIKKNPQQVIAKRNNNLKKMPQPPAQLPAQPQPAQIQQPIVNAPKNNRSKSKSRSRSSSRGSSKSSNRSSSKSSNKDSKSTKSNSRSTRKPKYQNGNQHIIAKLFGKNNVNQKALHELIKMLQ